MSVASFRVVGVTFDDRPARLDEAYMSYWTEGRRDGLTVSLRPEPDNPYDPGAVAVDLTTPPLRGPIGYVPKNISARIQKLLLRCSPGAEDRLTVSASVDRMWCDGAGVVGLDVRLEVGRWKTGSN